jgi:predicted nucleic acid-binding protein
VRTVLDIDVLVAAFRSDQGASGKLVDAALRQKYPLLLSVPLVLEYEAVLNLAQAAGLFELDVLSPGEAVHRLGLR